MNYFEEYRNPINNLNSIEGILKIKDEKCYVNDEIIENNRAIDGDNVIIEENKVIQIRERHNKCIIGVIDLISKYKIKMNNKIYHIFKPLNKKYPNFYVSLNTKKYTGIIYVIIKFKDWNKNSKLPYGDFIDIIGKTGDLNNDLLAMMYYHDIYKKKLKYNGQIKKQNELEIEVIKDEDIEYNIFSIDPKGSKDLDDAFHFKENDDYYEVGVHISYPSYMLDKEFDIQDIFKRVSTIYTSSNIDMIPSIYSENICSLIENKKRYAYSVIFIFNKKYQFINFKIKKTKVYVEKNYSYEEYQKKYFNIYKTKYSEFIKLSNIIFKKELDSHTLVEEWMIKTNKTIAQYLIDCDFKHIIVRSHRGISYINENNHDNDLNEILKKYKENSANYVLYNKDENQYHSKMSNDYYTHFTSPLRRCVDYYTQMILDNKIKLDEIEIKENIEHINKYEKKLKKFYRDQKKINYIYEYKTHIQKCEGYIIQIKENALKIYVKELDFEIKYKLFPYHYLKCIEVSYEKKEDQINKIIYKNEEKKFEYILYDKVKLELHFFEHEINVLDKIKVKIIEE
jgi:exoribonuclease R